MRTVARRLAESVLLLWLVLSLTFVLLRLAPGDPAALLVPPGATAADARRVRADLALDRPVAAQYAAWLGRTARGDLGESFATRRPVSSEIAAALPVSLLVGGLSLVASWLFGVAAGTLQGARRGSRLDGALTVVSTTAYAAPSYWLALTLVALFTWGAARWGFPPALRLPAFGLRDPAGELTGPAAAADVLRHLLLPVLVLSVTGAAGVARYARSSVADLADADWVRTARAKGLARGGVYGRHLLANARAPLVVLFALALPGVVAGSVFVENVFALPGMGRLMLGAIAARDYPVVLGAAAVYAALVIGANLLGDLALPLVDPRRRDA